jgi:hypothetical protein
MGKNRQIPSVMSVGELSNYLPDRPSIPTIYTWIRKGLIPYYRDARIFFRTEEVDGWLALIPPKTRK